MNNPVRRRRCSARCVPAPLALSALCAVFAWVPVAWAEEMEIVSVLPIDCGRPGEPDCTEMHITTTGAEYYLDSSSLSMVRRINPLTNSLNPRCVAVLDWPGEDIGTLRVKYESPDDVVITSTRVWFSFRADSLVFVGLQ